MTDSLLLDTSLVIWILTGSNQVSSRAKRAIFTASASLTVSIVSVWEIVLKYQAGKLQLSEDMGEAIDQILYRSPWDILPVRAGHLTQVLSLPSIHKDPFDRILIAQALQEGMCIVTPDEKIAKYDVRTLW